jgi:hypothetical protein
MTTPKPTPEKQNSPAAPDSEETRSNPDATGFFKRVRQELKPEPQPEPPIHPTEAAEIVIMDEGDGGLTTDDHYQ